MLLKEIFPKVAAGLELIFEENKTGQWLEADTINFQNANLAAQNMQKKYCTPVPPSTPFSQASTSETPHQAPTKKKHSQQADPMVAQLTLSKNPNKTEPLNHYCQVLCLPGTVEHNIKAQRLEDYIETELNMYMTKVR